MPPTVALEHLFRVTVGILEIGTFSQCSGIGMEYDITEYHEGGNNGFVHKIRGALRYPNLVLTGGMTSTPALLSWMLAPDVPPTVRPSVEIAFALPDGSSRHFAFAAAMPVRWSGPSGDAGANAVATESLEIAHWGLIPSVRGLMP